MTEAIAYPQAELGRGWTAFIYPGFIEVTCSRRGDPLPEAIRILLPPEQRRLWMTEWLRLEDDQDVWLLEFDPQA